GTQQSGIPQLHIADLVEDVALLQQARQVAMRILDSDPKLDDPKNAPIAGALRDRMRSQAMWGRIS
ncbi:MAG: hypothetical protein WEC15_04885, partial [Flavobacteriales bacterium]